MDLCEQSPSYIRAIAPYQPGKPISQLALAVYPLATQACGATGIVVPAKNYAHDFEAMLAAITPETRLVFIANPNNPTGTFATGEEIGNFIARVRRDVAVVVDEAYSA